jgi:hypothetical protein
MNIGVARTQGKHAARIEVLGPHPLAFRCPRAADASRDCATANIGVGHAPSGPGNLSKRCLNSQSSASLDLHEAEGEG